MHLWQKQLSFMEIGKRGMRVRKNNRAFSKEKGKLGKGLLL